MEPESRALSASRSGDQHNRKRSHGRESDDMATVSTSASYNSGSRRKRQSHSSSVAITPEKKRRKRNEDHHDGDNTVVVYNLPENTNSDRFARNIAKKISEIRHVEVEVVKCRLMPPAERKITAFVKFRDSDEARLALSLNGLKFAGKRLYVRIYDPEPNFKKGLEKQELCIMHMLGACGRDRSDCRAAHGLADLRLYKDTVLERSRCVYINELPDSIASVKVVTAVLNRYKEHNIDVCATYFQHRKAKQDAFFEFANPSHAAMAPEVLDGLWSIGVHPWKPEYQAVFVAHFGRDDSEHAHAEEESDSDESDHFAYKSDNDSDNGSRSTAREDAASTTHAATQAPALQVNRWVAAEQREQGPPVPPVSSAVPAQLDQTVLDLKATIISLREELLHAKTDAVTAKEKANDLNWKYKELTQDHTYNLQKLQTLEKDNADFNKRLDEARNDAKYYQDKWDRERVNSQEYTRLKEKVHQLQRENESLCRQLPDSKREKEQSMRRIEELERRLGGATDRNDMYLKDLKVLRDKVQQLESTNRELQRREQTNSSNPIDSSLELKLQEAMSRNESLEKALKESNEKVDQLDYANHHLRKENETMAGELEKVRGANIHNGAPGGTGLTQGVQCRVKAEPMA